MKIITIAEFRKNMSDYLDNLPVALNRYDEPVAIVLHPNEYERLTQKPKKTSLPTKTKKKGKTKLTNHCQHGFIYCLQCNSV